MNKRGREENFAFGSTDQSNSHRKPLLMRTVQEKKGGRQGDSEREENGVWHAIPTQKKRDESYTEPSARHWYVCIGWGGVGVGCLKGVFKIVLTSSLRERQRQGQVN